MLDVGGAGGAGDEVDVVGAAAARLHAVEPGEREEVVQRFEDLLGLDDEGERRRGEGGEAGDAPAGDDDATGGLGDGVGDARDAHIGAERHIAELASAPRPAGGEDGGRGADGAERGVDVHALEDVFG